MAQTGMTFRWEIAPSGQLIPGVDRYEDRLIQAIGALADFFSAKISAYARQNAPWNDQTGAARQGLRSFVVKAATQVTLYLVHSVRYGIWLELGNSRGMAPRPIIMPALQAFYGPLMQALRQLVGG